jgi:hypothetical protein
MNITQNLILLMLNGIRGPAPSHWLMLRAGCCSSCSCNAAAAAASGPGAGVAIPAAAGRAAAADLAAAGCAAAAGRTTADCAPPGADAAIRHDTSESPTHDVGDGRPPAAAAPLWLAALAQPAIPIHILPHLALKL